MPDKKSLTEKQKIFISEYLKDFNATRSALKAGYSENTAYSIGNENLKKPEIRDAIKKYLDDALSVDKLSLKNEIIKELKDIAFDPMTDEDSRLRHSDKIKAIELLGKYMAMWTEKVEHSIESDSYQKLKELYGK